MYKRVILKLSGEALAGGNPNQAFDDNIIKEGILLQIKKVIENGTDIGIIIGGGNFWRGRSAAPFMDRVKADQIGMLATVMNALYLVDSFKQIGVEAVIMTPFSVGNMSEEFSKEKALQYFNQKKVIIFAGGIGHPFFSTDTITSLRAAELSADIILFAKSVDGVYDKDPLLHKDAKKFEKIHCSEVIEKNLKVIDISAASLCYEQKIPFILFKLLEENSIIKAINGEEIGTTITV